MTTEKKRISAVDLVDGKNHFGQSSGKRRYGGGQTAEQRNLARRIEKKKNVSEQRRAGEIAQAISNRSRRRAVLSGVPTPSMNGQHLLSEIARAQAAGEEPPPWTENDVAGMIEIKRRCVRLALDWSAPPLGTALTANNLELVAMNATRFIGALVDIRSEFGFTPDSDEAWEIVANIIGEQVAAFERATKASAEWLRFCRACGLETTAAIDDDSPTWSFMKLWLSSAFARLEVGHQLAGALCCTDVPETLEVRAPWPAWSLIVPDGLFGDLMFARIWCVGTEWLCTVLSNGKLQLPHGGVIGDMVRSLIRGACLAIDDPNDYRKPTSKAHSHGKHRTTGAPNFEQARFLLAKPVAIDLREHVAAAASGRAHSAPKVQFLVRGHWREQAHGPKRALRKTLWIEPFWKGPEDSRILLRSHALKEGEK